MGHDFPIFWRQQEGRSRRAGKAADGSRGVEEMVVGRLNRSSDTSGNLVANYHGTDEFLSGSADVLTHSQRGCHGRNAGVIDRILEDVIELDSMG
ncbi:hypothetical protein D9M71_607050 [compost metagenome]